MTQRKYIAISFFGLAGFAIAFAPFMQGGDFIALLFISMLSGSAAVALGLQDRRIEQLEERVRELSKRDESAAGAGAGTT